MEISLITASVVNKVTNDLPVRDAPGVKSYPHLQGLDLADPQFDKQGRIDILLGNNIFPFIRKREHDKGSFPDPVATSTVFGWAIMGLYNPDIHHSSPQQIPIVHVLSSPSYDELLQRFWETEEVATNPCLTPEEQVTVDRFNASYQYLSVGRFQVSLPKRPDAPTIGESRSQAVNCFKANERSIVKRGTWPAFQQVVQEYLDLNHAELVPEKELERPMSTTYYLPMHGVSKDSSSMTKLRVVFDASAKTSTGVSTLMVGPTLYPNLMDVLLRLRSYRVVIAGDISKMYRAVELTPADRDLHRFVWRADQSLEIRDYRMKRVTFGVASSPFLAVQALHQTASNFGHEHTLAAHHVKQSFYIDDRLAGTDTPDATLNLQQQLRSLLLKGGFDLRKWRSNSKSVLDSIPAELHDPAQKKALTEDSPNKPQKALGLIWDASDDVLFISIGTPSVQPSTKRGVVSDVARTFDVLGGLAPSTISMKILFQKLWELKLEWDEEVPHHLQLQHQEWRVQLHLLKDMPFPRCYFRAGATIISTELHGFCDASDDAYAATVYIRTTYASGLPSTTLVASKTKVALLK